MQSKHSSSLVGALELLTAIFLMLMVVLTFLDVFARYLFASPIKGSLEIIQFAMALVIFTALPLVTRQREQITVSLVEGLVKGASARRAKQIICDLISLAAVGLLTWRLWIQAGELVAANTRTIVLGWPMGPLAYAMTACAAATAFIIALQIMKGDAK